MYQQQATSKNNPFENRRMHNGVKSEKKNSNLKTFLALYFFPIFSPIVHKKERRISYPLSIDFYHRNNTRPLERAVYRIIVNYFLFLLCFAHLFCDITQIKICGEILPCFTFSLSIRLLLSRDSLCQLFGIIWESTLM